MKMMSNPIIPEPMWGLPSPTIPDEDIYEDGGRPIYIASNPQNNGGVLSPDSVSGTVAGLTLRVNRQISGTGQTGLGDYSMVVVNPDSYQWFESPRFQLRTNVNSDGTIDLLYYGYGALAFAMLSAVEFDCLPYDF